MKERKALRKLRPYVPGAKKQGAVKLSSNENPLGPSPRAEAAVREAAGSMHRYPDKKISGLRERLARRFGVGADQVIVGNGSDELMVFAAGAFLEAGEETITARHTFSQYEFASHLFDGNVRIAEMREGRFDLDAIARQVTDDTKLIFLCNPNNPTGTYFAHGELVALLDSISPDILVVMDEAYSEYADAPDFPRSIELAAQYGNLLVLHTFSKIYGLAGLRVGYGIGSREVVASLERVRQPFNVSLIAQHGAAAALDDEEFVERSRRMTIEGRDWLQTKVRRLGLSCYESQANFVCIDVPEESTSFAERVAARGTTVRPLASFGLPNAIRVTVGTKEHNQLFIEALEGALEECRAHYGAATS